FSADFACKLALQLPGKCFTEHLRRLIRQHNLFAKFTDPPIRDDTRLFLTEAIYIRAAIPIAPRLEILHGLFLRISGKFLCRHPSFLEDGFHRLGTLPRFRWLAPDNRHYRSGAVQPRLRNHVLALSFVQERLGRAATANLRSSWAHQGG